MRHADRLAQVKWTPRGPGLPMTHAMGSLGHEFDANTIKSQNMERSRNGIGETVARQTGSGLSAA
ncbi:MAG: hypothetical protein WBE85_12235 [Methylocella sp.]